MNPATVGLDLAKNVFHVHVADALGKTLDSKRLARRDLLPFFKALPSCLIGIEACATAHNWARQLQELGHNVRLVPPAYVKPFVRRGAKNDATDAAAICEAVTRPNMRFVPIKSREDQAFLMLHRAEAFWFGSEPWLRVRSGRTWPSMGSQSRRVGTASMDS